MKIVFILACLFLITSCFKANSPKELLSEMLSKKQDNTLTKEYMESITHGDLRAKISLSGNEAYEKDLDTLNVKNAKFKIISENCESKDICTLTYILSYKSFDGDKQVFTSEVKKIGKFNFIDEKWYLTDMSNIKTYHESTEILETK